MTYTLRQASLTDLDTLGLQRQEMFADMGMPRDGHLQAIREQFLPWVKAQLQAGTYFAWLTEHEGVPVAGAALMVLSWPPGHLDLHPERGYLLNVYTHPDHRGKGLARQLVQQVMEACQQRGISVLSLHASEHGRSVYQKLGFLPTNEMRLTLGEQA